MITHAEAYKFWETISKNVGLKPDPEFIEEMIRDYGGTEESVRRNLSRYAKEEQTGTSRGATLPAPDPATRRPDFPPPMRPRMGGRRPALIELIFPMPRHPLALVLVIFFVWPITISFALIAIPLYPFYLMARYF